MNWWRGSQLVSLIGISLLLAACQPASRPTAGGSQNPSTTIGGWGVLYGIEGDTTYNLGLLAPDGRLVANLAPQRQYHVPGTLIAGQEVEIQLPPFAASRDRLYYFDGSTLKYVTADGNPVTVRTFQGARSEYAIAVTDDNSRLAVARFDYATSPLTYELSVQDLDGGHSVRLSEAGLRYTWPIRWEGSRLIVAAQRTGYSTVSTEGVFFSSPASVYKIDAATGGFLSALCASPVGTHALCRDGDDSLFIESWDGTRLPQPQVAPGRCYPSGTLSPDGKTVGSTNYTVLAEGGCDAGLDVMRSDASGGRKVIPVQGWPTAFLDTSHLVYATQPEMGYQAFNLLDLGTGATHPIDFMHRHCRYCYAFGVASPA
jgi:hypothetical protein